MRPQDLFDLNLSTLASLFGLILTYIIVLGQFKVGENLSCNIVNAINATNTNATLENFFNVTEENYIQ